MADIIPNIFRPKRYRIANQGALLGAPESSTVEGFAFIPNEALAIRKTDRGCWSIDHLPTGFYIKLHEFDGEPLLSVIAGCFLLGQLDWSGTDYSQIFERNKEAIRDIAMWLRSQ